ncbi:MAG TPA: indole-3-glycerol phosphate synthase TrpC [Gemmatimonadaceae bacterium]|nr:indole-3-glycerol phosphate synthase TrpC [Gemmatimonadaceae bacterium]
MQASPTWTPPTGTLGRIVAEAEHRARALEARATELSAQAHDAPPAPGFASALRTGTVGVIAEIKRRSPSKGSINPNISAAEQARAYVNGGAAAISVLTEPDHFGGSPQDLVAVRSAVPVPVLKKDFHVAPIQLVEAKALGASAALLIARALAPEQLRLMLDCARDLQIETLVEIRDEAELALALAFGAAVIGINNRNLETLEIDPSRAERLLAKIPGDVVAIAESGVSSRADVERVALAGADAVLVGSVISAAADPMAAVRSLADVPRVARGR